MGLATAGPDVEVRQARRRTVGVWVGLVGVVVGLGLVSLAVGSRPLSLAQVGHAVFTPDGDAASIIVWRLRMPRTLLAVLVGADLAVAGVIMQALTRNRLAEPGLLGVNAGAALTVVLAISLLGVTSVSSYVWFAFVGSAMAAALVYWLAGRYTGDQGRIRLVLAGAAISASISAATGIVTQFDSNTFDSYRFWVVGALADRGTEVAVSVLPFSLAAIGLSVALGRPLNALAFGDDLGAALGVRVAWTRGLGFLAVILASGAATAAAGPISFVGLAVPQLLRWLVGPDTVRLVLYAVLAGPALVLTADILGRVLAMPGELEVGIVTAFLGAPFLLAAVLRRTRAV